jgi:hypothetical protein
VCSDNADLCHETFNGGDQYFSPALRNPVIEEYPGNYDGRYDEINAAASKPNSPLRYKFLLLAHEAIL